MEPIETTPQWAAVAAHARQFEDRTIVDLYTADLDRPDRLSFEVGHLGVDLGRNRIDQTALDLLVDLADAAEFGRWRDALLHGAPVNTTENRPALHTALRAPSGSSLTVDGVDVAAEVHAALEKMAEICDAVRSGEWQGHGGDAIETVVNIGIGGSNLGPRMVARALRGYADGPEVRFVSNVDGVEIEEALADLEPATTMFIVCSKSFGTIETLTNARTARAWLLDGLDGDETAVAKHFLAVSANLDRVAAFGIDPDTTLPMWDWVGGRYSVDSAIGLSVMMSIGPDGFREFLAGFHHLDEHFRHTPLVDNVPVLMGLIDVWYRNFLGAQSKAVIPYADDLSLLPAYLEQLEMESNGKRVDRTGRPVGIDTGAVIWGQPGTDGQHAFFQLFHQGTALIPIDLIGVARSRTRYVEHDELLLANLLAQSEALAFGHRRPDEPHRDFPGNRPTSMILMRELSPRSLGELIGLWEHRTFTQGVIWQIDSFDQWGVELGKELAEGLLPAVQGGPHAHPAPGTEHLLRRLHRWRN